MPGPLQAVQDLDPASRLTGFVREEPELAAAAVLVGVLVLILLAALVRWYRRPMGARLRRALSDHDRVAVLMHPNPDPDAMAAALGVATFARAADTEAVIQYPGQIRHQENRAFQTVLDLAFDAIEARDELAADAVVLVDHNEPRGFEGADAIEPVAVVDHHPGDGVGSMFTDVRPEYGACASILAEYFSELGVTPSPPDAEDAGDGLGSAVATGLLYGILADTNHLTRGCSQAEFEAAAYLHRGVDEDALDRIANPQVGAEVLEIKARAISNRDVKGSFAVSDVGEVSNADAIPQAADELLRLEGVTAVVVLGRREGTIHLSGRSRDDRVHMGKALQHAVDDVEAATAGGHARMGGGQLPVEQLAAVGPGGGGAGGDLVGRLFDAMTGDV